MEVLFHFFFELFKIALLASVYTTLIIWVVSRIAKRKPESQLHSLIKKRKKLLWWSAGCMISIGLFVYMRSYWGDHGLGDHARIPVGHGKAVKQIDASWAFIEPEGYEGEVLSIDEYTVTGLFLIAKTSGNPEKTAIWNLKTNSVDFVSANGLDSFKSRQYIVRPLDFQDFSTQYDKYWHGWRFWLLP